MTTTTPTTDRLRARLAYLRESENVAYQKVLATDPYSTNHLQAHGNWARAYGRYHELKEIIAIYLKEED